MATLGDQAVGSIVKLNVDGTPQDFVVVHHGLPGTMYDSSCDGVWLLSKDLLPDGSMEWDSDDNDYLNSDIHVYLNETYFNFFDENVKNAIKQVKIPYTNGTGDAGTVQNNENGLSTKIFLPSYSEVGKSGDNDANVEGAAWSYFYGSDNSLLVAYLDGSATAWWLRSPRTSGLGSGKRAWTVTTRGAADPAAADNKRGVRPSFLLPYDFELSIAGTIAGTVSINGVQRELTGKGYIDINGVLRDISDSQVNIGGTLRTTKG